MSEDFVYATYTTTDGTTHTACGDMSRACEVAPTSYYDYNTGLPMWDPTWASYEEDERMLERADRPRRNLEGLFSALEDGYTVYLEDEHDFMNVYHLLVAKHKMCANCECSSCNDCVNGKCRYKVEPRKWENLCLLMPFIGGRPLCDGPFIVLMPTYGLFVFTKEGFNGNEWFIKYKELVSRRYSMNCSGVNTIDCRGMSI